MSEPPWIALLVAASVSIIAALFSFPYRYLRCWIDWSGIWGMIWIFGYFIVAGVGGLIGWLVGWLAGVQPTPVEAVNGLIYGAAGALAIGAQVKGRPSKETGDLRDVKSLLIRLLEYIENALDELTCDKAAQWLRTKTSRELVIAAWQIEARVMNEKMTTGAKKVILDRIVPAMEAIFDDKLEESDRGRRQEQLMDFCVRYYVSEHLGKPTLSVSGDAITPKRRQTAKDRRPATPGSPRRRVPRTSEASVSD